MYYYCVNSANKVIHLASCYHIQNLDVSNIASFNDIIVAEKNGYRVCKHCEGLRPYYNAEKEDIKKLCKSSGISVKNCWSHLYVNTVYGQWKIIYNENQNQLELYHRNTFENGKQSLIPHYHKQNVQLNSITRYLNDIISHDEYRRLNPINHKKYNMKPTIGSRAWHELQKKNKLKKKRHAIGIVLTMIESI